MVGFTHPTHMGSEKKTVEAVSPLMRKLSSYIAAAPRRPLPRAVAERAKHHLLDTLAAMVSGSQLLPGRRAIAFAAAQGGAREACVIGSRIVTSAIKRWPVGYPIQAPLDAVSNLIAVHDVRAGDVERVVVTIDEQGARTVNQRKMASINIQHLVAVMLLDGDITFASSHDEARVRDPAVLNLKKRIELAGSRALSRTKTTQAIVEITTRGGKRLRHHTKAVRGTAANPMSRAEVAAKARDLLAPVLGVRRAQRLIDTVWRIERVADVRQLRPLLQA